MKKILISGLKTNSANYVNAVMGVWAEPVLRYCPDPALAAECDGLILCGGEDIDPAYYGQGMEGTQEMDLDRDRAEFAVLKAFLDAEKPVLGICRGLQTVNVFFGGTLAQDIPGHGARGGADGLHPVRRAPGAPMPLSGGWVNSAHHQAADRLGSGLRAVQWAEDGVVEALVHRRLPVWAVQWHPERLEGSPAGRILFRAFLALGE